MSALAVEAPPAYAGAGADIVGVCRARRLLDAVDLPVRGSSAWVIVRHAAPSLGPEDRLAWFAALAAAVTGVRLARAEATRRTRRLPDLESQLDRAALAALVLVAGIPNEWRTA